jgi:serine/threonine protein kinase
MIPSTIRFVEFDAIPNHFQICIADCDLCVEFDRWQQLRKSGISVDFRRIVRFDSHLVDLSAYLVDISSFSKDAEVSRFAGFDVNPSEIYQRMSDGVLVVVESILMMDFGENFESQDGNEIETEVERSIENELNLRHLCITARLGFVIPTELRESRELKVVGLHSKSNSLSEVISCNPVWWTPTVKAKAVVGVVLGLRYCHSLGLLHGNLNSKNIFFDSDYRIEMIGFLGIEFSKYKCCRIGDVQAISGEEYPLKVDVRAFASILFEIVIGSSGHLPILADTEITVLPNVPRFVSELIETGISPIAAPKRSFNDIFNILKQNGFEIMTGVDSEEVSNFVNWIEFCEQSW